MSTFFVVETSGYRQHWRTFEQALADFLRLLNEGEAEDIALRFSA